MFGNLPHMMTYKFNRLRHRVPSGGPPVAYGGTMNWFKIGRGVCQDCILSPCLFNLYAFNVMRNARLDEAQAGIKKAERNTNNLRYADDTTLMVESKRN